MNEATLSKLAEAQGKVDGLPELPQMQLRKDTDFFSFWGGENEPANSWAWHVALNYRCLDTFGPQQRVQKEGVQVEVWAEGGQNAGRLLDEGEAVVNAVEALLVEARAMCAHRDAAPLYGEEARAFFPVQGACLHTYRCRTCGAVFQVDSSD